MRVCARVMRKTRCTDDTWNGKTLYLEANRSIVSIIAYVRLRRNAFETGKIVKQISAKLHTICVMAIVYGLGGEKEAQQGNEGIASRIRAAFDFYGGKASQSIKSTNRLSAAKSLMVE